MEVDKSLDSDNDIDSLSNKGVVTEIENSTNVNINISKVKDLYFTHRNIRRISSMYMGSKCQRSAALVAASELGIEEEVKEYFKDCGVKWYHYIPYFMVKDPLFFFRKTFWERTFLEKHYSPSYDFRKLQVEGVS